VVPGSVAAVRPDAGRAVSPPLQRGPKLLDAAAAAALIDASAAARGWRRSRRHEPDRRPAPRNPVDLHVPQQGSFGCPQKERVGTLLELSEGWVACAGFGRRREDRPPRLRYLTRDRGGWPGPARAS